MLRPETFKVTSECGPRPAGKPDECFYCKQKLGEDHKEDCVIKEKTVIIQYNFKVKVSVPAHWTKDDIEFHRNESSWCSDNALKEIEAYVKEKQCSCSFSEAIFIRDANEDD